MANEGPTSHSWTTHVSCGLYDVLNLNLMPIIKNEAFDIKIQISRFS